MRVLFENHTLVLRMFDKNELTLQVTAKQDNKKKLSHVYDNM